MHTIHIYFTKSTTKLNSKQKSIVWLGSLFTWHSYWRSAIFVLPDEMFNQEKVWWVALHSFHHWIALHCRWVDAVCTRSVIWSYEYLQPKTWKNREKNEKKKFIPWFKILIRKKVEKTEKTLPKTGDTNSVLPTILGTIVLAASAVIVFFKKKKA